jgi:hypothetical protein
MVPGPARPIFWVKKEATMKRFHGGTKAEPGFYWSTGRWAVETVSERPAVLAGPPEETYVRIPMLAMLAVAPVMGGLFAVFLPLIGFVMVFRELGRGIARRTRRPPRLAEPRDLPRAA